MREYKLLAKLLYLFGLFFSCYCADPCLFRLSVDITNGSKLPRGNIKHNGVIYSSKQYFSFLDEANKKHTRGCICSINTCVRKCCPLGQGFKGGKCVQSEESIVKKFNPLIHFQDKETPQLKANKLFSIVHNNSCGESILMFPLNPNAARPDEVFYLQKDGRLYLPKLDLPDPFLGPEDYCLEAFIDEPRPAVNPGELPPEPDANWTSKYLVNVCLKHQPETDNVIFNILSIGFAISIPFLLATFLVYAFIPELRNFQGKTIMNYIAGLILAFISLIVTQQGVKGYYNCVLMAFSAYFFWMVSFFWLNIMCIDIWWTFRNARVPRLGGRDSERRRYFLYCLYGWGAPVPLTVLLAFMQFKEDLPMSYIRPNFGIKKCWFDDWKSNLLYFYVPVLVLVVFNLILFSITSYKILMTKLETAAVLNTAENTTNSVSCVQYKDEKQRFFLYFKLFIFMGMNWITEVLSFVIGGSAYIWITTDVLNTMLGVFIFFTFVWKKRVKNLIFKRYNTLRYGPSESDIQRSRYRSKASSIGQSSDYSERIPAGGDITNFIINKN